MAPAAGAEPAEEMLAALNDARQEARLPGMWADPILDAAALSQAQAIADRPASRRFSGETTVDTWLSGGEEEGYRRTWERVDLARGVSGDVAAREALARWRESKSAWEAALDPGFTRFGYGFARADDGWMVTVLVLAEPLERSSRTLGRWERDIARRINSIRRDHGLGRLSWNEGLAEVARSHSRSMALGGYLDHRDDQQRSPADRVRSAGIGYEKLGENVARNRGTEDPVEAAITGWLESRRHREQLLTEGFEYTGVGIAIAPDGTYYFTQLFLR